MSTVPQVHRLFVYGTLRRNAPRNPMQELLAEHSQWLGEATVQAKLYRVGAYTGIVYPEQGHVSGEVFTIDPAQWDAVMTRLDEYEGADYRRQLIEAVLQSGETVTAWAYTLAEGRENSAPVTP
jgi:gamma-glutamylcyclotransferase (GGCT)/AIG2-like uncharacterized protein YtfP